MKFRLPKNLMTGARWNMLTVLFVSLAGIVFVVYAVIFANPKVLPAKLQVPPATPTRMPPTDPTVSRAQPFPTFPPEWTAVFATRRAQPPSATPTWLSSTSGPAASPTLSATPALTASLTVSPVATLLLTPSPTGSSPTTPEAGATLTPSPVLPTPTPNPFENPTGYPLQYEDWTPSPFPPGYPFNP